MLESLTWKESSLPPDSSSSETGKDTPPEVQFTLGDDEPVASTTLPSSPQPPLSQTATTSSSAINIKSSTKEKSGMVRSFSQDTSVSFDDQKMTSSLSKTSLSDNSLDNTERRRRKHIKELPTVMSVDDETLSTDSNSTADNDELKRRRRNIFPGFRKNKGK